MTARLSLARIVIRHEAGPGDDDQTPIGDPPDDGDWDDDEDDEDDDDDEEPLQAGGVIALQHRHQAIAAAQ